MAVKCSADQLNSDYNFLNISARDLILVSSHMFSISRKYNETHDLWLTSVGLTDFENGCHSHILFIQYSAILALGHPILVSNSVFNIKLSNYPYTEITSISHTGIENDCKPHSNNNLIAKIITWSQSLCFKY